MISLDVLWFVSAGMLGLCVWLLNRETHTSRSEQLGLGLLPTALMMIVYVIVKALVTGEPK